MRKFLFAALVSSALVVGMPAAALAHHHHHHIRHEKFGSETGTTTMTSGVTMSSEEGTAGTVDSFTNGLLTIRRNDANHTLVSGMVTDATELKCDVPENEVNDNDGDDSGSGDRSAMEDGGGSSGDSGSSDGGSGDNNLGEEQMCTTANLTPGTVVQEAELNVSSAGSVWHDVELVTP